MGAWWGETYACPSASALATPASPPSASSGAIAAAARLCGLVTALSTVGSPSTDSIASDFSSSVRGKSDACGTHASSQALKKLRHSGLDGVKCPPS